VPFYFLKVYRGVMKTSIYYAPSLDEIVLYICDYDFEIVFWECEGRYGRYLKKEFDKQVKLGLLFYVGEL
jgi:hypothetical protein